MEFIKSFSINITNYYLKINRNKVFFKSNLI